MGNLVELKVSLEVCMYFKPTSKFVFKIFAEHDSASTSAFSSKKITRLLKRKVKKKTDNKI